MATSGDTVDPALGRAIPYGIFDKTNNEGWVSVGDTAHTAEFARSTTHLIPDSSRPPRPKQVCGSEPRSTPSGIPPGSKSPTAKWLPCPSHTTNGTATGTTPSPPQETTDQSCRAP
jgi:hypothetical protein